MASGRQEVSLLQQINKHQKARLFDAGPAGYSPVISMLRDLMILLGQTISADGIQVD